MFNNSTSKCLRLSNPTVINCDEQSVAGRALDLRHGLGVVHGQRPSCAVGDP